MNELEPGDRLGAFRIRRRLGSGGSGVVYQAERIDFPQTVAIKVFAPGFSFESAKGVDREAGTLASLDHRHIVRILSRSGELRREPAGANAPQWLVMEYVEGEPVDTACDRAALSLSERLRILIAVCDAVAHAHRRLLLHGDLKPANVLLTSDESELPEPKLLDFGSARAPDADGGTEAEYTHAWASPEQRAGERTTVASDIWSLGLLARLLLTGLPATAPADGPVSHLLEGMPRDQKTELARLRSLRDPAGRRLQKALRGDGDAILQRALALRPEHRYATAEAFGADLEAWARGQPVATRESPGLERVWKWARRHRGLAAASGLLAVVLLLSVVGVAITAARAASQRREAERQLAELVRMTGTLDSELFGSVRSLPGSAAAQSALLEEAHETLRRIVPISTHDARLRRELADQYVALARLEMSSACGKAGAIQDPRRLALQDLAAARALLPVGDAGQAEFERMRDEVR